MCSIDRRNSGVLYFFQIYKRVVFVLSPSKARLLKTLLKKLKYRVYYCILLMLQLLSVSVGVVITYNNNNTRSNSC